MNKTREFSVKKDLNNAEIYETKTFYTGLDLIEQVLYFYDNLRIFVSPTMNIELSTLESVDNISFIETRKYSITNTGFVKEMLITAPYFKFQIKALALGNLKLYVKGESNEK